MSGSDGPAWAPEGLAGLCWMLREQLVETIDAIRRQAEVVPATPGLEPVAEVVPPVPGLEPVGERSVQVPRN
ncbi:hypothetical protein [Streptomyces massasporeus]|uniref:hypothetical protein n=1 Tax=Streptomyces massasporeus TaxID=67324 RepID=UPI0036C8F8AB